MNGKGRKKLSELLPRGSRITVSRLTVQPRSKTQFSSKCKVAHHPAFPFSTAPGRLVKNVSPHTLCSPELACTCAMNRANIVDVMLFILWLSRGYRQILIDSTLIFEATSWVQLLPVSLSKPWVLWLLWWIARRSVATCDLFTAPRQGKCEMTEEAKPNLQIKVFSLMSYATAPQQLNAC